MSRVLITGGTGFIGVWVTRELIALGHAVRIFDLAPQPENLNFVDPGLAGNVDLVTGDIRDPIAVAQAMRGIDVVIHLVGLMTVDCAADPKRGIEVNLIGGQTVFDAAAAQGVGRVIYASTAAVYGPADPMHPRPMTLYGVLKLALEGVARIAHADHGITSAGFRPAIVYGPGESAGIAAGPSIALRAALMGHPAVIGFSGRIGFVHVADVARAMGASVTAALTGAQVFDLCGATEDVAWFRALLKRRVPDADITITGAPLRLPEALSGGENSPWFDALPTTSLQDGIDQTLAHWRARPGAMVLRNADPAPVGGR